MKRVDQLVTFVLVIVAIVFLLGSFFVPGDDGVRLALISLVLITLLKE